MASCSRFRLLQTSLMHRTLYSHTCILKMSFLIAATGWTAEKDAFPLKYAFGALSKGTGNDCKVWGPSSNNPENTAIMPAGSGTNNALTLCVVVQDSFGSFATAQVNITSRAPETNDLGSSAVNALFSRVVEAQVNSGNLDKALSGISNIASTIQDSAVSTRKKLSAIFYLCAECTRRD